MTSAFADRISLNKALLGFSLKLRHLDGHEVLVSAPGVCTPGQVLTIPHEGLPVHGVPSEFGELRVTLLIDFPSELTPAERVTVRDLFPGKPPRAT